MTSLYTRDGILTPSETLGRGRSGAVFTIAESRNHVIKLYRREVRGSARWPELLARLIFMTEHSPAPLAGSVPVPFAWPQMLAYADRRGSEPVGFVMAHAHTPGTRTLALSTLATAEASMSLSDTGALIAVAAAAAGVVAHAHRIDIVLPDLKPENFLIHLPRVGAARVSATAVDCDSFDLPMGNGRSRGQEITEMFCAPDVLAGGLPSREADRFALAELIGSLLTLGQHPFAGIPRTDAERSLGLIDRVRAGLSPWLDTGDAPMGDRNELVPAPITELIAAGCGPAAGRPSAVDWERALNGLELTVCGENPRHRFSAHAASCPWCAQAELGGHDFFPPDTTAHRLAGRRLRLFGSRRPERVAR